MSMTAAVEEVQEKTDRQTSQGGHQHDVPPGETFQGRYNFIERQAEYKLLQGVNSDPKDKRAIRGDRADGQCHHSK
ncbi:MAG: hypothetical protein HOJ90_12855 [Alphaproteobacteria bacterium]|nr:hypothetical protein [Alphaproteobacteria bacterium]